MKYLPKLPEHNDNVSHEQPVREFFLLLAGVLVVAALGFWGLGMLVDFAVDRMSPEVEARINRAVAFKWEQEKPFSVEKQAMLQKMTEELARCAAVTYPIKVYLTESEQPNAAVLPGGHVIVFSGLLDKVQSRNGLSFVLAHELSHLKNRDHLRAMGRSLLLVAFSSTLMGAHSDITQIFVPLNQLSMAQHSQEREMQADNKALQILNCHYGHVGGATEFFETMKNDPHVGKRGFSHYFSSHPELRDRINNIVRQVQQGEFKLAPVLPFEHLPS